MSKLFIDLGCGSFILTGLPRSNPAVISVADKAFVAIALALEAETIQGQTARRAAAAAKQVVQSAGIDAAQILGTLNPETQQTIRNYFA